jgi:alanine racemase
MNNPLMIIRIDSMIDNLKAIERTTGCSIMPVIKSDAYGMGSRYLAKVLVMSGIKMLVTNTLDEAKPLLELKCRVLILSSLTERELKYSDHFPNIIFTVNSVDDALRLKVLKRIHPVHLNIDTGMNRTGIRTVDEAETIICELKKNPTATLEGIYTHFASGPEEMEYYRLQVQKFKEFLKLYPFHTVHTANSASLKKPLVGSHVRIGIALYGYNTNIESLKKCVRVYASPVNLFTLKPGECLGYDMTYKATAEQRMAVLPIGYNDGLLRGLEGLTFKANGRLYPIVGKICMNHCFIIADGQINYHSSLELIGKDDRIYEMAKKLNCSVHQILCLMQKMKKIYVTRVEYDFSIFSKSGNKKSTKIRKRKRSG